MKINRNYYARTPPPPLLKTRVWSDSLSREAARRLSVAFAATFLLIALAPRDAQAQCASFAASTVSVVTRGSNQLTLSFDAPINANDIGYWEVDHRETGTTSWSSGTISNAGARSHAINGLKPGTTYEVRLRARAPTSSLCPPGPWSTIVTGATLTTALTVTGLDGRINVNWLYSGDLGDLKWQAQWFIHAGGGADYINIDASHDPTTHRRGANFDTNRNGVEWAIRIRLWNPTTSSVVSDILT